MIAHRFRHERPRTIDDVLALLAEAGPEARVLGGGSLLVPAMVAGEETPKCVIDLGRLRREPVQLDGTDVVLAATATYADALASDVVAEHSELLMSMASGVTGGIQLHNTATLAGAACQAAPGSDVPGCLVALGARMRLVSVGAVREVAAEDFFVGALRTARRPDELLLDVIVPSTAGRATGYVKVKHSAGSWPIVTAACVISGDGARVRLAIGAASALLLDPWDDVLADGVYRRQVAPVAARRALQKAGIA